MLFRSGIAENQFNPKGTTTRGMIVTILNRMDGEKQASTTTFTDVPANAYYANAVAWASENGIVNGYGNRIFAPNDNITREQIAVILYNYASYKNADMSKTTSLDKFNDGKLTEDYAVKAMEWAVASGLFAGTGSNTLNPKGTATRAGVATLLTRIETVLP